MKILTLLLMGIILGGCSPEAARAFQQAAQNAAAMERANQASMPAYQPMPVPTTTRCQKFANGMITCRQF